MPLDGMGLPDLDKPQCGRTEYASVLRFFPKISETNATDLEKRLCDPTMVCNHGNTNHLVR